MLGRRQWRRRQGDPDEVSLRRVGRRLAALTVGLLSALLLALGVVTYVTVQHAQITSLQDTLRGRLQHPPHFLLDVLRVDQPLSQPLPANAGPPGAFQDRDGVFFAVVDARLTLLGGAGPSGQPLFDRDAARKALREGMDCCARQTRGGQDYLIYSQAFAADAGPALGVIQASISEGQYDAGLHALLRGLLIVSALGLVASAGISSVLARRALRPIRAALRRQRDFVADAAHELPTPLTIMRTATELGLAAGALPDLQASAEQTLVQNAHLTRLVDSLSLLARADSGVVTVERQPVDLTRLAVETAGGIAVLAEERNVRLRVEAPEGTRVLGDAGRLRQLLLILLDNALRYTPDGGAITVSVERHGGQARLQVRDTGPGIAPHDLPRLFERFYRADRARTGEGTGLGLSIGRWIADAHGGGITAANDHGHGAVFTVTLPSIA